MRKLALRLEELSVETFETGAEEGRRGTVFANSTTQYQIMCTCETWEVASCDPNNCGGGSGATCNTCGDSCGCDQTWEFQTCATGYQINCGCWW